MSTQRAPVGQAPEALWRERRDGLVGLARERGMVIEHGGHVLPELLAPDQIRALMKGHPPSDDARRALERYVLDHPEADVLHLWGVDLPPDVNSTPDTSDAALRATNAVAAVAEDVRPGVQVTQLAYPSDRGGVGNGHAIGERVPAVRPARALLRALTERSVVRA